MNTYWISEWRARSLLTREKNSNIAKTKDWFHHQIRGGDCKDPRKAKGTPNL